MRSFLALASVCSVLFVGCSAAVMPLPSEVRTAGPTRAATPLPTAAPASLLATELGPLVRYVALGDSYTIGTSVKPRERWPNQLTKTLMPTTGLDLVENLGVNGATSADVIDDQLDELPALKPGFLSLLIGVNDVVRRVDIDIYRKNLRTIFGAMLEQVPANRILLVTTPDYTLTPQGEAYGDPARNSALIRQFNEVLTTEAGAKHLLVVDITPVSDRAGSDRSLVADDGLHPSGKQYAGWVELIAPQARALLRSAEAP